MISIIMPIAPDAEISYISLTIESIKKQTYNNWYIYICVPNNMKNIIKQIHYTPKICEYIILPENFVSKYETINSSIDVIKSEWVAIVEPGDEWYSNKLENQFGYSNRYDIIGSGCRFYGARGGMPDISYNKIKSDAFLRGRAIIDNTVIMKRHLCNFETKYGIHSDYRMFYKHHIKGTECFNIPEVLSVCKISRDYNHTIMDLDILNKLKKKYKKYILSKDQ